MTLTTLSSPTPRSSPTTLPSATTFPSPSATTCPSRSRGSSSHAAPVAHAPAVNAPAVRSAALARYTDHRGHLREILALRGYGGSVLVVDRNALSRGDRRLVAHLAADEPFENAGLVCRDYLRDPRAHRCRRLAPDDLLTGPFSEGCEDNDRGALDPPPVACTELYDRHGRRHRIEPLAAGLSIPELRWCWRQGGAPEPGVAETIDAELDHARGGRRAPAPASDPQPESVRDVVACMESYESVRALTARALVCHRGDPSVSVAVLRCELQRIDASRIVLNRGLRRAVLHAMRTQGLSLSEIAYRCGRVKRDRKGNSSGETSWLARRVGISPEGGSGGEPTPWIHSEVLALIAREGLGISPREVEL
jgi:hypothetical protein